MEEEIYSGLGNGGGTEMDTKVVQTFQRSFVQVQGILDQNRLLINEINQNHESNTPDNLTRNVGLIRELNNNIRRVVGLYADLSSSFTKSGAGAGAGAASSEGDSSAAMKSAGHKRNRPA
ncbi:ELF4-like 3 [Hibiscus trionum]|uniref:ELF4-like 3 n=1 Tax=Hibiscus trionum TaxID=183268 RepID=A0A9W7IDJ8_HIBTR|nr:ELF4-like 3 [Hibiscus trionum]